MAAGSYERLSSEDEAILELESASVKGHKANVIVVGAGPGGASLGVDALRAFVGSRLAAEPRSRQRVEQVPFGLGRPLWIDDPEFDISDHVRDAGEGELDDTGLRRLAAELMAAQLDHSKP
ncbi:MAG: wax ester/triacylglycerol synthase domain-containing protein, partial [Solirubrobacterales bacterium]